MNPAMPPLLILVKALVPRDFPSWPVAAQLTEINCKSARATPKLTFTLRAQRDPYATPYLALQSDESNPSPDPHA
jgi:hypothetical protein